MGKQVDVSMVDRMGTEARGSDDDDDDGGLAMKRLGGGGGKGNHLVGKKGHDDFKYSSKVVNRKYTCVKGSE